MGTAELRFRVYAGALALGSLALLASVFIRRPPPLLTVVLVCVSALSATLSAWLWDVPTALKGLFAPVAHRAIWWDRLAWWLLVSGGVLCLILFAYVAWRFPTLPPTVPLHFNAAGQVDRIGTPADLFTIPLIGGLVWLVNSGLSIGLYNRDPMLAYVLAGGAGLTQLMLMVGALTLTLR